MGRRRRGPPQEDRAAMSVSCRLRQQGNDLFRKLNAGLAPVLYEKRAREALHLYNLALERADSSEERASCHFNAAQCHLKLAASKERADEKLSCWIESLMQTLGAIQWMDGKDQQWQDKVVDSLADILAALKDRASQLPYRQQLAWLRKLVTSARLSSGFDAAHACVDVGKHLHHCSVRSSEASDYSAGVDFLVEAAHAANAAKELLDGEEGTWLHDKLEELEEDLTKHQSICESGKARIQADSKLASSLANDVDLNMDIVWDVLDQYKFAIVITRELDIESEAHALSRLGMLYFSVIKNEERATAYLKQGLMLAHSLYPIPAANSWYQDITRTLNKIQQVTSGRHTAEWRKQREPILQDLQDDLDAIKRSADKGTSYLIKYLYSHHPPSNPEHKEPHCDSETMKQALKTCISHYHPDKSMQENDRQFVLCEEIITILNQKYSLFK